VLTTLPVPSLTPAGHLPGRIERFSRPFAPTVDLEEFASPAFQHLKTGQWGVRYYQPPPGTDPADYEVALVRVSSGGQTEGDLIPFRNQVEEVVAQLPRRRPGACLMAVYWDCQTAIEVHYNRSGEPVFPHREGLWTLIRDGWARRYATVWWWKNNRAIRGDLAAAYLVQMAEARGVIFQSVVEGQVAPVLLTVQGGITAKGEVKSIVEQSRIGKRQRVGKGAPSTGQVPHGWLATGHMKQGNVQVGHDPEAMPVFAVMLWGLRHQGWTWGRAAVYLNASGVRRQKKPDRPWEDVIVRAMFRHTWWLGLGRASFAGRRADGRLSPDPRDREATEFPVAPAYMVDPRGRRHPLTADDLAHIKAHAAGRPGPKTAPGQGTAPLRGLLVCEECGWSLVGRKKATQYVYRTKADGTRVRYVVRIPERWVYECPGAGARRRAGKPPCGRRPLRIRQERLLDLIWARAELTFRTPGFLGARFRALADEIRAQPDYQRQDVLAAQAGAVEGEIDRLWTDQGTARRRLPERTYERKLAELRARLEAVQAEAEELRRWHQAESERAAQAEALAAQFREVDLSRLWETLPAFTPEERLAFVREVVGKVRVRAVPGVGGVGEPAVLVQWDWVAVGQALEGIDAGDKRGTSMSFDVQNWPQHRALAALWV
jgi:hypothetical protein